METSCYVSLAVLFFQIFTPSIYGNVSYDGSVNISKIYSTCSKGWFEYGDLCYKVGGWNTREGIWWEAATKECKEEKGVLATIYDQEMSDFFSAFLVAPTEWSLWIGLDDRVSEGDYKWADGSPYPGNFTNYRPNEPAPTSTDLEDCTVMEFKTKDQRSKMGQWNDVICNKKHAYICQKAKEAQVSKSDPRWMFRNTVHNLDNRYCKTEKGFGWRFEESPSSYVCFDVVPEKKSWLQAEDHCVKEYKGHLATLDYRENYYINYVFREVTEQMWIGVKIKEEPLQKWSSGWPVTFENWAEQEKFVDGTCLSRDANGTWLTQPCEKELWFICEYSTSKAIPPPELKSSLKNAHCPKMQQGSQEWRDIGGDFCYFVAPEERVPWHEASYDCWKRGGTLASIHSEAEFDIVSLFARYYETKLFYIGLYRPKEDANEPFIWVDGSLVNYTRWKPGEPNNVLQDEQCTEIWNFGKTSWNDIKCTQKLAYICSTQKIVIAPNNTQTFLADDSNITTVEILLKEQQSNTITIYALSATSVFMVIVVLLCIAVLYYFKFSDRRHDWDNNVKLVDFLMSRLPFDRLDINK